MWESERIYHALAQLLDDIVQSSYVFESHRYLAWTHHLHSDILLVGRQDQLLLPLPFLVWRRSIIVLTITPILTIISVVIAENTLQSAAGRERFLLRLGLCACVWIESR